MHWLFKNLKQSINMILGSCLYHRFDQYPLPMRSVVYKPICVGVDQYGVLFCFLFLIN